MPELIDNLRNKLRASLWFVPALLAGAGMALALVALVVDRNLPPSMPALEWVFAGGAPGAADLLSTIATSMLTVAGVAFSITIVTLSLASRQFGPRLLRTFMRDRGNQWVLGVFVGTFLYCLVALMGTDQSADGGTVPRVVVGVAFALALTGMGALIYFIHHVSMMIQSDTLISQVAQDLDALIERFYPEDGDEPPPEREVVAPDWDRAARPLRVQRDGYVEAVSLEGIIRVASARDAVVRVQVQPGDHVVEGDVVLQVWPAGSVDEELSERLLDALRLGKRRTEEQDVRFAVDQLVEVAVRALSPSLNDPFTAMSVIDRLAAVLCRLAPAPFPSPYRYDGADLRAVVARTDFEALLGLAVDPIRQHANGSVLVLARLLEAVREVAVRCPVAPRRDALRRHADKLLADVRRDVRNEDDRALLEARHGAAVAALDASARRAA